MNSPRLLLLPLAAAAALAGPAARGQGGDATLSGMVTYRGGEPANARIYLGLRGRYRQVGTRFRAGKSTGYQANGLLVGRYELVVLAPNARPRRIWGVPVQPYQQNRYDVVLERASGEEALLLNETGVPIREDVDRTWPGGWLQGALLTEKGSPVDGLVKFYRGPTVFAQVYLGTPHLPAYFESRGLQPGTYDLLYVPPEGAPLKPVRIEKVGVAPDARTILDTIRVPAGHSTNPPVVVTEAAVRTEKVPEVAPRPPRRSP